MFHIPLNLPDSRYISSSKKLLQDISQQQSKYFELLESFINHWFILIDRNIESFWKSIFRNNSIYLYNAERQPWNIPLEYVLRLLVFRNEERVFLSNVFPYVVVSDQDKMEGTDKGNLWNGEQLGTKSTVHFSSYI